MVDIVHPLFALTDQEQVAQGLNHVLFVKHAQIGSTIVIDGKELPLRPSAAIFFRGSQGHVNSGWNCLEIDMLNHIVGAADVPGGAMGHGPPVCHGHPTTGKPETGVPRTPSVAAQIVSSPACMNTEIVGPSLMGRRLTGLSSSS